MAYARQALGVVALSLTPLASGCQLDPDLAWVLRQPELLALRVEVVETGPYEVPQPTVPIDRVRAQPMPLDTVRVVPFIAGPDGVIDPATLDPIWLACATVRCDPTGDVDADLASCEDELSIPVDGACRLGQGASVTFRLADLGQETAVEAGFHIRMVSGSGGEHSTDECLELFRGRVDSSELFRDCLNGTQGISVGPWPHLQVLAAERGLETAIDLVDLPPELLTNAPDFNPEIPAIRVDLKPEDGDPSQFEVQSGEHIEVASGTGILLTVGVHPSDRQLVIRLPLERGDPLPLRLEDNDVRVFLPPEAEDAEISNERLRWVAPTVGTRFTPFFVLLDGRSGVDWAWLDVEVVEP